MPTTWTDVTDVESYSAWDDGATVWDVSGNVAGSVWDVDPFSTTWTEQAAPTTTWTEV